jgi:hypothetical protein
MALQKDVSRILFEVWDPIGVREMSQGIEYEPGFDPHLETQYQAYEGGVLSLLLQGASEDDVAVHLDTLAEERIGLRNVGEQSRAAAEALVAAYHACKAEDRDR